jgi:predicted transcriptional regulator YdeE
MSLNEKPETIEWPETHYIFLETTGPIPQNAPQAWQEFHKFMPELQAREKVTGAMSLYRMQPEIYRAGYMLASAPGDLPAGVRYEKFAGGKYALFTLTGPYKQLGPATGRVMQLVSELRIPLRDGFNIENYANDPSKTPEDQLITEIMVPVA